LDVLHVPYTYWPDAVGGTEIYVAALVRELQELGVESGVAAPGRAKDSAPDSGVFRWSVDDKVHDAAYGRPDPASATAFRNILARTRPHIVHLHARTSAVSSLLLREARAAGARTVFTYHTPSASCMRGTMMLEGREPCDGILDGARCTRCVLQKQGVPGWAADLLCHLPRGVGGAASSAGLKGGPVLALRMRQLVDDANGDTREFLALADRVIAVCDWVADVLRRNGVRESRLVLNRQGIASTAASDTPSPSEREGPLRIACFGRIDPAKGIDILIRAVSAVSGVELDVFGVSQGREDYDFRALNRLAAANPRCRLRASVTADEVAMEMKKADLVAVPSIGLETGPLVVLEAFAAGTPVLGSRLGGIAEIVRDGVDGVLVSAGDIGDWESTIRRLAENRGSISSLRAGIRPPRTMRDVAVDMNRVYAELLSDAPEAT
jgi:glycosyltransferase involved in cell wall biosynthesis